MSEGMGLTMNEGSSSRYLLYYTNYDIIFVGGELHGKISFVSKI